MQERERVLQSLPHAGRVVAHEVPAATAQAHKLKNIDQTVALQRDPAQTCEELEILYRAQLGVELEIGSNQSQAPPPLERVQLLSADTHLDRAGARSEQSRYNPCQCALAGAVGARDDQNLSFPGPDRHTGE